MPTYKALSMRQPYAWLLDGAMTIPDFIPLKGRLGLFDVELPFQDVTLCLGPLTVLLGANASGKSNLRDALRFLHGVARGYTLADTMGGKYGTGGELQWRGLRGGTAEAAKHGSSTFSDCSDYGANCEETRPRG